ncbi:MAG: hypothetical protein ACI837_003118, partial [Crocinitomicaceae bacterium]
MYFRGMQRIVLAILLLSFSHTGNAQRSFFEPADSLQKGRFIGITSGITAGWAGSMIGLSQVWYSKVEKSSWHTFDDSKNWLQMDKVGHFYISYKENQFTSDLFRWTGLDYNKSLWIGTGVSIGYQTTFELFDAFSKDWGFSWSDVAANSLGTVSYTLQSYFWQEERIIPKFSYYPTEFAEYRPEVLGGNFTESLLKDYNGQTYWLSFSPGTFFKESGIPEWACFSFGYSAHAKLVGDQEFYQDPISGTTFNSQREFIFSLDIDFSKLPIKRPWLKAIVRHFNYFKVPFPALILRGNSL